MSQTCLLYIEPLHLTVYQRQKDGLARLSRYAQDEEGLGEFAQYLETCEDHVFLVLADLPDESFFHETVPFVRGADRQAMLTRKVEQHCYGTELACALSLGRQPDGRHDEYMLFHAISRPQALDPWLDLLHQHKQPLQGIWSAAQLSAELGQLLQRNEDLVLIHTTTAGIRQTYIERGKLRFSRLSSYAVAGATLAQGFAAECSKLMQYLAGQRMINRNKLPPVILLSSPAREASLLEAFTAQADLRPELVDIAELAKRAKLSQPAPDLASELLMLHLLACRNNTPQLAPPSARQFYRLWQGKRFLRATGWLGLIGGLLISAHFMYGASQLRQQADKIDQQRFAVEAQLQALIYKLPALPTELDNLRGIAQGLHTLDEASHTPLAMMSALSQVLDSHPDIQLEKLDWRTAGNVLPTPANSNSGNNSTQPIEQCTLNLSLSNENGFVEASRQRMISERINRFVQALNAQPGWRATLERAPIDVRPDATSSSSVEEREVQRPRFSVSITSAPKTEAQP